MDPTTVGLWRDVALIFLMAEGFILILPALFLLVYTFRGLRQARASLLPLLTSAHKKTERVEEGTHIFSSLLVNPIIGAISGGAFVLEAMKAFLRR